MTSQDPVLNSTILEHLTFLFVLELASSEWRSPPVIFSLSVSNILAGLLDICWILIYFSSSSCYFQPFTFQQLFLYFFWPSFISLTLQSSRQIIISLLDATKGVEGKPWTTLVAISLQTFSVLSVDLLFAH